MAVSKPARGGNQGSVMDSLHYTVVVLWQSTVEFSSYLSGYKSNDMSMHKMVIA